MYFGNNPDPAILESIRNGEDIAIHSTIRFQVVKKQSSGMRLNYFLLAAIGILATTADGLADENNKSSTPNAQVAVKGGNAATEGMVVLQSDDIDDTQQVAGRAVATEERALRALASLGSKMR
ncbi:hypothetical protein PC129_g22918 [Phytophthora cactorum]|uniref:Uncharacterized protein n=1 Tax=Phytophthora cactorum TaxID=29920 RepID=A0A8T1AI55_9STRA|nr:hypothetical protein PC111_g22553 [Phytophthora cactorum]KAG2794901.1 hypothetical protein PC112_g22856 [Phytophthora cactorum]KAG2819476.1 hypothetical protein PC113_g22724 [Phytophthora cactorum]KAG2874088.1 hypothetical protein PC114_g25484 [Phytophthora cactorum]KAG2879869.1 hypothetical protein PC115_g22684 [Phytophthora cactorum]